MKLRISELQSEHFSDPIDHLPLSEQARKQLKDAGLHTVTDFFCADPTILLARLKNAPETDGFLMDLSAALCERLQEVTDADHEGDTVERGGVKQRSADDSLSSDKDTEAGTTGRSAPGRKPDDPAAGHQHVPSENSHLDRKPSSPTVNQDLLVTLVEHGLDEDSPEVLELPWHIRGRLEALNISTLSQLAQLITSKDTYAENDIYPGFRTRVAERLEEYICANTEATRAESDDTLRTPSGELSIEPSEDIDASSEQQPATERSDWEIDQLAEESINLLDLGVRARNCLKRAGIEKIGTLATMTDDELLDLWSLGKRTLDEIQQSLKEFLASASVSEAPRQSREERVSIADLVMDTGASSLDSLADSNRMTIGEWDLSSDAMSALRNANLYPSDPVAYLGKTTLGYLAKYISASQLNEVIDQWDRQVDPGTKERLLSEAVTIGEDKPVIRPPAQGVGNEADHETPIPALESLIVEFGFGENRGDRAEQKTVLSSTTAALGTLKSGEIDVALSVADLDRDVETALDEMRIRRVAELAEITEEELLSHTEDIGLTIRALVDIRSFAAKLSVELSGPERLCYETHSLKGILTKSLTDVLESTAGTVKRNIEICTWRWGIAEGYAEKDPTLERIGEVFGLTRERVRQIVQRAEETFRTARFQRTFRPLMRTICRIQREAGEPLSPYRLAGKLHNVWGWDSRPTPSEITFIEEKILQGSMTADYDDADVELPEPEPTGQEPQRADTQKSERRMPNPNEDEIAALRDQLYSVSTLTEALRRYVETSLEEFTEPEREVVIDKYALKPDQKRRQKLHQLVESSGFPWGRVKHILGEAQEILENGPHRPCLEPLISGLYQVLGSLQGAPHIDDVGARLCDRFDWDERPARNRLRLLCDLAADVEVNADNLVTYSARCERLDEMIAENAPEVIAKVSGPRKLINFAHDLMAALPSECDGECPPVMKHCPLKGENNTLPPAYVHSVLSERVPSIIDADTGEVLPPDLLALRNATSQRDAVKYALASIGEPTYYKDLTPFIREHDLPPFCEPVRVRELRPLFRCMGAGRA